MQVKKTLRLIGATLLLSVGVATITVAQNDNEPSAMFDGEYSCNVNVDQGGPGEHNSLGAECLSVETNPTTTTTTLPPTTTTEAPTTTSTTTTTIAPPVIDELPMGGIATGTVLSNPLSTDLSLINSIVPGGFVRGDYTWKTVQPNATTWAWSTYDTRIAAIHAAGLEVLPMLGYTPAWANGGNADDKHPPAAGFEDEWRNFCYEFANRYIPQGLRAFEVWNEPNLDRFWKPAPNVVLYVNRVLIPCADGLRAAALIHDEEITVISGGTSPAVNGGANIDPRTWATGLYANGAKGHFDALAHHPYTWPFEPSRDSHIAPGSFAPNQWNAMIQTKAIRATMVANGDGALRIWATEAGLPSSNDPPHFPGTSTAKFVSHCTYATRVAETFAYWFGMPTTSEPAWAGPIIWYQHRNQSPEPLGTNTEGGFGVVYNSGGDKPCTTGPTPRAALTTAFANYS